MSGPQRENGQITIEALMINTGLTDEQVDPKIAKTDFPGIAHLFNCIDELCDQFELSNAERADVRLLQFSKNTEAANNEALRIWIKKYRYKANKATFKNLLTILLKIRREDTARKVANYVSNRHPRPGKEKEKQSLAYYFIAAVAVILAIAIGIAYLVRFNKDQSIPYTVPTPNLTMTDFKGYWENETLWFSPPVYTHHRGYKIRLGVDANGYFFGIGAHIAIFVDFMRGEFDDSLKLPFRGTIHFKVIDQLHGEDHREFTATYDDNMIFSQRKFIELCFLKPNYLLDNTLMFQIASYFCV